jgi:RNA polymerase sigma factor (sigma-70 family)
MQGNDADTPGGNEPTGLSPANQSSWHDRDTPEDRRLIGEVLNGDEAALQRLIERYDRLIRYTVFRTHGDYCRRDPAWLDARANEAWIGIVRSLRRAGPGNLPGNLSTYFIQITKNKCRDAAKASARNAVIPLEDTANGLSALEAAAPSDEDPAAIIENLEQIEHLRDCMARLGEDDRVLCSEIGLIMERRWREAADQLGLPESTLRSRWQGVMAKLKRCLEKKIRKNVAPGTASTDS